MQEISLQALLEAGCHFGHKAERWNPKASEYIYTKKDGIHILDLAKTKSGLEAAMAFVKDQTAIGGEVLFIGTKRQAAGVVKEEAEKVSAPYLIERWIGGFLTNWDSVRKNIQKINRMVEEQQTGAWKKFPKHEQSKLTRYLARLKKFYGGVLTFNDLPAAVFIVDVRKEDAAVREAKRRSIPIIAIVDTNSDPTPIDYVIPANDDAVGSIQFITHGIAQAYREGKESREKEMKKEAAKELKETKAVEEAASVSVEEKSTIEEKSSAEPVKKKRGRPAKVKTDL